MAKKKTENQILKYSGEISAKPRMTQSDKWKVRPATTKYWAFKDMLTIAARQQGFTLGEKIRVSVNIQMPKSWSAKKRQEMCLMPHRQKPDLDNILKSIQDILMKEDSGIHEVHISKSWSNNQSSIIIQNIE